MSTEREKIIIQSQLERVQAMEGEQPWVREWTEKSMNPDTEALRWLCTRPREIHPLLIKFPPSCLVMTRPEHPLHCPAPGTVGIVSSYFEAGTIGVRQCPDGVVRAQCMPDWLEVVGYRQPCTPDWMRKLLKWEEVVNEES